MKQLMKAFCPGLLFFVLSCNTTTNKNEGSKDSVIFNYENIPAERKKVDPDPLRDYTETINNPETTDEFKLAIYETKETFHYLIKFSYKNLEEEDTLKVPNFGIQPSIEIKRGESRPSCIPGFYDEKKQFRKLKLIWFDSDKLQMRVLKRYAVGTYQSEAH